MTITEFLLARIAEDEDAARGSGILGWVTYRDRNGVIQYTTPASLAGDGTWIVDGREIRTERFTVQVVHDEARILAECQAKRRIASMAAEQLDEPSGTELLQLLALPYVDHDDYQEEWRP